jgi:hypothetical protein
MFMINLDWENWNNEHSSSFLMQNMYWVPRTNEISVIFKQNIPIGVTITIFINIFSHNHRHFINNFMMWQPLLTPNFHHHQAMIQEYECLQKLNTIKLQISPFYIAIDFALVHFTHIFNVILMLKEKSPTYGIWFLYTLIFLYHGLTMTRIQGQNLCVRARARARACVRACVRVRVCVCVCVIKNTDKYYEIPVTKIQNNLREHKKY